MLELSDEHRRHTVKRRAALLLDGAKAGFGIKRFGRKNDGGAVSESREASQDTAEAVIERHGQADAIVGRILNAFTDGESVVEDVVVRKGRALGRSGRAGGVLNADR